MAEATLEQRDHTQLSIECDRRWRDEVKLHAIRSGLTLRELVQRAIDDYTRRAKREEDD
ncbi:MAG TPA: hypothetical protein VIM84_15100 [Gemmatimonadales bacterium]